LSDANSFPSFDPAPQPETPPLHGQLAPIWRRFLAFSIDCLILGAFGIVIGMFLFNTLAALGPWGRLVGFLLVLPYFALFESRAGDGQSPGKRALGIRVVDAFGNSITLDDSVLRYIVCSLPFFLNSLPLPATRLSGFTSAALALIVIGAGGTNLYLLIFNRNTRQGLHDLATSTYVVRVTPKGLVEKAAIWRLHWLILGSLFVTLTAGATFFAKSIKQWTPFPELLQDAQLVEDMDGVQRAGVQNVVQMNSPNNPHTKVLAITAYVNPGSPDGPAFANEIAKSLLEKDPHVTQYDRLNIVIVCGYDLGFASGWRSNNFSHSPAQWTQLVSGIS
jgi:uncharacterized RDD family membrane protein YckC